MRSRGWLGAMAVVGLVAVCVPSISAARAADTTVSSSVLGGNCGGAILSKPGGGQWQCSFDDEFNGTTLNPANWVVQRTSTSGYTTGQGSGVVCYVNSPNNVSVSGGYLNLTIRKETTPIACGGGFTSSYSGGMVSSYQLFTQTYGLYQVRAKLPSATVKGLQETLWLWPADDTRFGAWPASGEIDFSEFYSQYSALDIPFVHYVPAKPDPNVTAYNCTINQGQFNTYGLQWTSTSLTVSVNGRTCLVDQWDPAAPMAAPEPFNQPFFVALTQALGVGTNAFVPGTTPLPATTQVDWVRVWK